MITEQKHTGNIKVEEYSLAAWLAEVETVIKQGYTFDFESNDTFPQAFGSMYTVTMVPVVPEVETEKIAPSTTVDTPPEITVDEVTPVHQTKRKNARN